MRNKNTETVIETARQHVGYRSRAQRVNQYGAQLGSDGMPWAGAFLEIVMREAREHTLPNLNNTASALAEFTRLNRNFRVPQVGDLVFYGFNTDGPFTQPHIGIVTDVSKWKTDGMFKAIEGQTASGMPKGPQESDGVYERRRYATDVLTFVRPKYGVTTKQGAMSEFVVHPSDVHRKSGKAITAVQLALADAVGAQGMAKGVADGHWVSAVQAYQRRIGAQPTGIVDEVFLARLSLDTNYRYFSPKVTQ